MPWMRDYLVSYVQIIKSKPKKVKAQSTEEAQDMFRKLCQTGEIDEEEKTFQMIVQEFWKKY